MNKPYWSTHFLFFHLFISWLVSDVDRQFKRKCCNSKTRVRIRRKKSNLLPVDDLLLSLLFRESAEVGHRAGSEEDISGRLKIVIIQNYDLIFFANGNMTKRYTVVLAQVLALRVLLLFLPFLQHGSVLNQVLCSLCKS